MTVTDRTGRFKCIWWTESRDLSIARAIAKDPEIYIFDDSFSALDYKTDVTLRSGTSERNKWKYND